MATVAYVEPQSLMKAAHETVDLNDLISAYAAMEVEGQSLYSRFRPSPLTCRYPYAYQSMSSGSRSMSDPTRASSSCTTYRSRRLEKDETLLSHGLGALSQYVSLQGLAR